MLKTKHVQFTGVCKIKVKLIRNLSIVFLQEIILGDADIVVAGASENMSQAPFAVRNARWGINLGEDRKVCRNIKSSALLYYKWLIRK